MNTAQPEYKLIVFVLFSLVNFFKNLNLSVQTQRDLK